MDEENFIFPSDLPELNTDSESFNIEDYLFEPDPSKIKDISNFDQESDWIPRLDRFGEYLGDGILEPRKKIVKAVFHGFYEDLDENSNIHLLKDKGLSFISSSPEISFKEISDPIHIITYNADVLFWNHELKVDEGSPWITTNLDLIKYKPEEKFLIQCFELVRFSHLTYELAERLKHLAIVSTSQIQIENQNYELLSVSLYYFVLLEAYNSQKLTKLDLIEIPVCYSFSKKLLDENYNLFKTISSHQEVNNYEYFLIEFSKLFEDPQNLLRVELSSPLNTSNGDIALELYLNYIKNIKIPLLKLIIIGELISRLYRVFPERITDIYETDLRDQLNLNKDFLGCLTSIRQILVLKSLFLYYDYIWAPSALYVNLAFCYINQNRKIEALNCLLYSNLYIYSKVDYIQILFPYADLLKSFNKTEFYFKLSNEAFNYLFGNLDAEERFERISFIEYIFLIYYQMHYKLDMNKPITKELNWLIGYMVMYSKTTPNLPTIPEEILVEGINIFEEFIGQFGYDAISLLVKVCPSDVFYTMYRIELQKEQPDLLYLIAINEYILTLTAGNTDHSVLFPRRQNYTRDRLIHYINLFVIYYAIHKIDQVERLKKEFTFEFSTKMDTEVYNELIEAISSESSLELFLIESSIPSKIALDQSIIYYLRIKRNIVSYFENGNLQTLLDSLLDTVNIVSKFGNYRSRFEGLKLIYQVAIRKETNINLKEKLKKQIDLIIQKYNLDPAEADLFPITDDVLRQYLNPSLIPIFLSPIK